MLGYPAFQKEHWCSAPNVAPLTSWDWSPGRSDTSCPLVYLGQAGCPGTSGLPVATNAPPVPDHLLRELQLGQRQQVVKRVAVAEARPQVGQLHGVPGAPLVPRVVHVESPELASSSVVSGSARRQAAVLSPPSGPDRPPVLSPPSGPDRPPVLSPPSGPDRPPVVAASGHPAALANARLAAWAVAGLCEAQLPLCVIAPRDSPRAGGEVSSAQTDQPPADSRRLPAAPLRPGGCQPAPARFSCVS